MCGRGDWVEGVSGTFLSKARESEFMFFLQLDYIRAKTFHGKYDTGDRKTDLEN